jgi:hypothetical protein
MKRYEEMKRYNEKAELDYIVILIVVMYWIIPLFEFLMKL